MERLLVVIALIAASLCIDLSASAAEPSPRSDRVAWIWNEECRAAIRVDRARPTVQARTLFHVSAAMFDAWAAFEPAATGFLFREKFSVDDRDAQRRIAISYAAYTLLKARYGRSPGSVHTMTSLEGRMRSMGLDPYNTTVDGDSAAAIGNRIGNLYVEWGLADGSREARNYLEEPRFVPRNPPLRWTDRSIRLPEPDLWQPIVVDGDTQRNVTPHWKAVTPFAFTQADLERLALPGPPMLSRGQLPELREQVVDLIRLSSQLDTSDGEMIDVSPASFGANSLGSDDGSGRPINPATRRPYSANMVHRGDFGRVLADFWSDGLGTDTPPGHWNEIASFISHDARVERSLFGQGEPVPTDEWDVKLLLVLNAALHDAAIASWAIKAQFEAVRPISLVRWMGMHGQCTDPTQPAYHEHGLPLVEGLIELVSSDSTAEGQRHAHLRGHEGHIAIRCWGGPLIPPRDTAGVRWRLATEWMPFQQWEFITPAFPGYVSGHSTFSRAAADVLTAFTGSEYFPGGLFEIVVPKATGLRVEPGPTQTVRLQWATYRDAADSSGLSRRWGGIHIVADDFDGRRLGAAVAAASVHRAGALFGERTQ